MLINLLTDRISESPPAPSLLFFFNNSLYLYNKLNTMSRIGKLKRQAILEANERNLGIIKEQALDPGGETPEERKIRQQRNWDLTGKAVDGILEPFEGKNITWWMGKFNKDVLNFVEKIGDIIYPDETNTGKVVTFYESPSQDNKAFYAKIKDVDFDMDTGNVNLRTLGSKFDSEVINPLTGTQVGIPDTRRTLSYECGGNSFQVDQVGGGGTVYQRELSNFIEKEYCTTDFASMIQQAGEGDEQSV